MEHKLTHENCKTLLEKCHYIGCKYLEAVCICLIASHFYVGKEIDSIQKKKELLNVKEDLTLEHVERLKKEFPFIEKTGVGHLEDLPEKENDNGDKVI